MSQVFPSSWQHVQIIPHSSDPTAVTILSFQIYTMNVVGIDAIKKELTCEKNTEDKLCKISQHIFNKTSAANQNIMAVIIPSF